MFTGIITAVGTVREAREADGGLELSITCPYPELVPGESIAVDGACLTAARVSSGVFTAHLMRTTLERTGVRRSTLSGGGSISSARFAPATRWAGIWCRGMWTGWAP